MVGSCLVSWLSIWEFFYLSTLFWATCLKAMTHQCSNQIHPAQGFLGAKLIPKLIPRQRGWHSIQTPPAAAPSAPWSPPQAIKRGLVGNGGKSARLAVLRGSNPNPYSLHGGGIPDPSGITALSRTEGCVQCGSGKGNEPMLPRVTDQGNASLELCHRKDLVSAGKTTKELAGYFRVPNLPLQTSLSSTQQPPLAMPEGAKDMLGAVQKISWELRLCCDLLLQWPPQNCVPAGLPCSSPAMKSLSLVLVLPPACTAVGPPHCTCAKNPLPGKLPALALSLQGGTSRWLLHILHSPSLAQAPKPTPAVRDPPTICRRSRRRAANLHFRPLEPQSWCWCAQRALSCQQLPG